MAGGFNRGFDLATAHGYARSVDGVVRRKFIMLPIYAGLLAATVWVAREKRRGFILTLDQGYAIIVVQLPDGASLSRTDWVTAAGPGDRTGDAGCRACRRLRRLLGGDLHQCDQFRGGVRAVPAVRGAHQGRIERG